MEKTLVYLEDMDALEEKCIAIRHRSAILYLYPFSEKVARTGAKIVTRDGRTVRKVRPSKKDGETIITGVLDDQTLTWDGAGRFRGPYEDHENDLYIHERYFVRSWKDDIKMSNGEWSVRFQRPHPTVPIPDVWDS